MVAAFAAAALVALAVAGCSTGSEDSASYAEAGGSDAAMPPEPAFGGPVDAPAEADGLSSERGVAGVTNDSGSAAKTETTADVDDPISPSEARSLIKTGNVVLHSDDVARARFDVQSIVDGHRGEVSDRSTETDEEGTEARARLVLRVPAAEFDATLSELEAVGDLVSSTGSVEDVTTQVIDTDVRVRLQKRSIERISVLLDRATSIRDIVAIERELSQREAELGSLEKRQAYLADVTAMSTITVSIQLPVPEPSPEDDDARGFLAGLSDGWGAFVSMTVGLLTATGAVLPFAALLLLLGLPTAALWRRRRPHTAAAAAPLVDAPQSS